MSAAEHGVVQLRCHLAVKSPWSWLLPAQQWSLPLALRPLFQRQLRVPDREPADLSRVTSTGCRAALRVDLELLLWAQRCHSRRCV
jgi:hypothetical protein